MRLILAVGMRAALRRLGRPAFGLLARSGCLSLAGGHLGLILGLLVREALLRARLDLGLRRGDGGQPLFAPLELLRQAHAVRDRRLVGGFGQLEQLLHLDLEAHFNLLGMAIRQRTVAARVGVDLGAVQADRAEPRELILPCHLQHLHEGRFELLAKALTEAGQGVMIGVRGAQAM